MNFFDLDLSLLYGNMDYLFNLLNDHSFDRHFFDHLLLNYPVLVNYFLHRHVYKFNDFVRLVHINDLNFLDGDFFDEMSL